MGEKLATGYYLDYDSVKIDWDAWAVPYSLASASRQLRQAPRIDRAVVGGKVEILLTMIEAFAMNMCDTMTPRGSAELQLALHALILTRLEPFGGSLGDAITPMLLEIRNYRMSKMDADYAGASMFSRMMEEAVRRFEEMHTPVLDGNLMYAPQSFFGVDKTTNW